MEKNTIAELKERFYLVQKKYSLPAFEVLAEEFDVEKAVEKELSSFILRDLRRVINEKLSAYLHLFETLRNPSAAPMFVFLMLKNTSEHDKKEIEEVYKRLAKIELLSLKLETNYSEKSEAEFLIYIFNEWQDLKRKITPLFESFEKSFDQNSKESRKGYFG